MSLAHALCLLGGVLLALWLPAAYQPPPAWLLGAAGLLLCLPRWRVLVLVLLGFCHAQHAAQRILLAEYDCGERVLVEARIDTVPSAWQDGWQVDAQARFPREPGSAAVAVRLLLPPAVERPFAGEVWQYAAQFAVPSTGRRAAQQRRILLRDHLSAVARVVASPLDRRLKSAPASLNALRESIAERIAERVADPAAASLLAALAVGVTGDVTRDQWRVFNAAGITHLVAISGLHVTFFAVLSMALARRLWCHGPWLWRWRRESFAAGVGILLAVGYALLSGWSVPAQRTVVMLAAFLLARVCGRVTQPLWSVGTALVAVLLLDPLAVLSAGFWLSFAAVTAIIGLAGGRFVPAAGVRAASHVQALVSVVLLPLTVLLFGTFSAIGPLVNALAIPLFSFVLVPPLLMATALYLLPGALLHLCADRLLDFAAWVVTTTWPWLVAGANWANALWSVHPTPLWLVLAMPAALLTLLPLPAALRVAAAALLVSGVLLRAPRPAAGEVWVDMLDSGASRAVVLRTRHHQLLYGLGESFGGEGRRFEAGVLPQLLWQGYPAVDLVLPVRPTRDDHAALTIAGARLPLDRVFVVPDTHTVPELTGCAGQHWQWDGAQFEFGRRDCRLQIHSGSESLQLSPQRAAAAAGIQAATARRRIRIAYPDLQPAPGIWSTGHPERQCRRSTR